MKKFLITGSSGYIGSHLAYHLRERCPSCLIVGIDKKYTENLFLDAQLNMDLCQLKENRVWKAYEDFLTGIHFDTIFHLAAKCSIPKIETSSHTRSNALMNNMIATSKLCDFFPMSRIIHTSTANEGNGVYQKSKRLAEDIIKQHSKFNGKFYGVSIRLQNVAGVNPNVNVGSQYSHLLTALGKATNSFTIFGDGSAKRNFVHVDDVCRALIFAANSFEFMLDIKEYPMIAGPEENSKTVQEIVDLYVKLNRKSLNIDYGEPRIGDIHDTTSNIFAENCVAHRNTPITEIIESCIAYEATSLSGPR